MGVSHQRLVPSSSRLLELEGGRQLPLDVVDGVLVLRSTAGGVETDRVPLYIQTTQITGQSFQKIPLNRQEAIRRSIPDKEHSL